MDETALINQLKFIVYTMGVFFVCFIQSMDFEKCAITYTHHYNIRQSIFTALEILCLLPIHISLPFTTLATTDLFTVSIVLLFQECHIEILQLVTFSDWLLSLGNMQLRFNHAFSWLDTSFLFSAE
uniref:Uncharacterized protein n=1 Tax=Myotis myotis TaxID=51298 RepID=A0A7J7U584_MYOMY|nr:hypothetical protein mMyoMyo1_008822 [Myotis myotis]